MPFSFGLIYKTKDMGAMVDYLYKNYDMMPLDWLIGEYISNVIKKKTFQGPLLFKHTSQSVRRDPQPRNDFKFLFVMPNYFCLAYH